MNYVVRPGDTLNSIAARFGVPVSEIIRVNRLSPPFVLFAGQTLFIPVSPRPPRPDQDNVERRLDRLDRRVDNLERRTNNLERRVSRLEERR